MLNRNYVKANTENPSEKMVEADDMKRAASHTTCLALKTSALRKAKAKIGLPSWYSNPLR
jgi:hypothetical protein